ncbi:MAG: cupin domain-containing protein [Pseudomonadota bacterium]|nr:cupin domain-containing protein [Pseudomonadota bacterium]
MNDRAAVLRAALIRNFDSAETQREQREPRYDTVCARLATGTAARGLGISVDTVAPGKCACPYHAHAVQEEAFVVLAGRGHLRVAGEMLEIGPGDVIFIPPGPQYPHQIVNTSQAPLKYLSIGTRDTPEVVEYPDSGKYLVQSRSPEGENPAPLVHTFRLADGLDYWDGEP